MDVPPRRPPGRPRSEESRRAILDATRQLIALDGFAAVTVEGIAARAGVGKQTIYRWWPTKADVVLEASADEPAFSVPIPDQGSFSADLRTFLRTAFSMAGRHPTADLLRGLMVEAQLRDDFGERFRSTFLEPRRAAFASLTDRAAHRGDLPAHPHPTVIGEIVFGTLWYRLLGTREALDDRLVDELVATLSPTPPARPVRGTRAPGA